MTKPIVKEHNLETDEIIEREMTDEEHQALLDLGWTPGESDDTDEPA